MNKEDKRSYEKHLKELNELKATRDRLARAVEMETDVARLAQMYRDLAALNQQILDTDEEYSIEYASKLGNTELRAETMRAADKVYELTTEPRPGYLKVQLQAASTPPEVARTIFKDIREKAVDARTGRVMIEASIAQLEEQPDIVTIMSDLIRIMPGYRIAFVNPNKDQREKMTFAALVGQNIGEDHQYFDSQKQAEDWLLGWD